MTSRLLLARSLILVFLAMAPMARAAPVEQELGNGLVYVRVHNLPADLPSTRAGPAPACVLDLRFVEADPEVAAAFGAWLKFRAAPRSPVYVVVNAGTSAALHRVLRTKPPVAGVISVGGSGGPFSPDSVVRVTPEEERKAYDAFENGVAMTALIAEQPNKVRVDEASLAKERPAEPVNATAAPRAPVVVDAVVQRAVHLHRSLQALKKI